MNVTEYTPLLRAALRTAQEQEKLAKTEKNRQEWRHLVKVCQKELYQIKKDLTTIYRTDIIVNNAAPSYTNHAKVYTLKDRSNREDL